MARPELVHRWIPESEFSNPKDGSTCKYYTCQHCDHHKREIRLPHKRTPIVTYSNTPDVKGSFTFNLPSCVEKSNNYYKPVKDRLEKTSEGTIRLSKPMLPPDRKLKSTGNIRPKIDTFVGNPPKDSFEPQGVHNNPEHAEYVKQVEDDSKKHVADLNDSIKRAKEKVLAANPNLANLAEQNPLLQERLQSLLNDFQIINSGPIDPSRFTVNPNNDKEILLEKGRFSKEQALMHDSLIALKMLVMAGLREGLEKKYRSAFTMAEGILQSHRIIYKENIDLS
jgi:hypothetical protein